MLTPPKSTRSRENDLPPKVQAAISFSRLIIGGMAIERLEGRWNEGRIPSPLESAVYDGALLVLLEYFEAPDLREEAKTPTPAR